MRAWWDPDVARWRKANGQFVSAAQVQAEARDSIEWRMQMTDSLATRVHRGHISIAEWQAAMREEIKREYINQGRAGWGGQMDARRWGSLGGQIGNQYRYLGRFAGDIAAGDLTEAQIRARSRMYIESAKQAYERAQWNVKSEAGYTEVLWSVNWGAENCPDCIDFNTMGWQKIADDPFGGCWPGSGCTQCLSNCKCTLTYKGLTQVDAEALRDAVILEQRQFEAELSELEQRLNAARSQLVRIYEAEGKEAFDKFRAETLDPLSDAYYSLARTKRERLLSVLQVDNPCDLEWSHIGAFPGTDTQTVWDSGMQGFRRLVSNDVVGDYEVVWFRHAEPGRSHYVPGSLEVVITSNGRQDTIIHELGHALEDLNEDVHRRAVAFLERRTAGESAGWLGDDFDKRERTKKDKFINPYMGKIYEHADGEKYATEIVSVGLETLYRDPVRLAQEDPEYFDFMIRLVRGL